jgi:hypothetical protein
MFGSDQMFWPEAIKMAVEGIESAKFLSAEQKRDIFYNNAATFLRLDQKPASPATDEVAAGTQAPDAPEHAREFCRASCSSVPNNKKSPAVLKTVTQAPSSYCGQSVQAGGDEHGSR